MGGPSKSAAIARFLRAALVALAVVLLAAPSAAAPPKAPRIIAVGDLHGDFAAWTQIARASGITDAQGHWTGGTTTVVQLGDIVDRQPDSLKIIRNLQQLQSEAAKSGGRVIVLTGNHEAMNLLGDFRYVTPGEFAAFADNRSTARREQVYIATRRSIEAAARTTNPSASPSQIRDAWLADHPLGWVELQRAWSPGGELGRWATLNPAIANIDGNLFVHGGISAEYAQFPIDEINRRVAAAMARADSGPKSILEDPLGPLWYRGLLMRDADAEQARRAMGSKPLPPEQELDRVLRAYGAQRLIVGHTPIKGPIQLLYGGRLARIDTAISRAYGGTLSWLEIVGGTVTPHSLERTAP
jgi:hypothetical protein